MHSGSFHGLLYLSTGAHWGLFQEWQEASVWHRAASRTCSKSCKLPSRGEGVAHPSSAMGLVCKLSFTPLRRGRFFCFLAHPTPPARHLKPDLIPLHAGNLLVYWAFLGGKLHCLYSWVQAVERLTAFLRLLSQGPVPHTHSAGRQIRFIGLLCHANKAV